MTTRPRRKKAKAKRKPARGAAKKAVRKAVAKKAAARKSAAKARTKKTARKTKFAKAKTGIARRPLAGAVRRLKTLTRRRPAHARVPARLRSAEPRQAAPRVPGVAIKGAMGPRYGEVLTPAALRFLAELHR